MKNLIKVFGIIALIAVIGFTMVGCPESDPGDNTDPDWGEWTVTKYPNKIEGGWERRINKLDPEKIEERRVPRTGTGSTVPEEYPAADRWTKEIDIPVTATLDYTVDSEGVCKITVGGAANTTKWKANAHYLYTAKTDASYLYKFEAWTDSGERTLSIQCYHDFDTKVSVNTDDITIGTTQKQYTARGGNIPNGGVFSLQFHCADQLGTFYVKMISITEYTPENLTVEDRWIKAVNSASSATLDYEVAGDGVCKITVGGTPEPNNATDGWYSWRARANYIYTTKSNTSYEYEIEAWTESGSRWMGIQYYYDNDEDIYGDTGTTITATRATYKLRGYIIKGGVRELRFQSAAQLGTFYVKILSITEYTPTLEFELTNDGTAYRVSAGTARNGAVVIPAAYNGKPVTSIGSQAFQNCTGITGITIPSSVTSISGYAFQNCTGLTGITIPAGVTSIGQQAFYNCNNLTTVSFAAGSQLQTIGSSAFSNCTALTSITIPASVTYIGGEAFRVCNNLTSVTFAGTISANNWDYGSFPGDLRSKYLAAGGGAGTYTRAANGGNWTKQ